MIQETAEVSSQAQIGAGTRIWHQAQVREGAVIGESCILGTGAYVDRDVIIGNNVKIQNHALIYHGATLEDGVFIGPQACLTNDRFPRAINPDGKLKTDEDWTVVPILIRYGASIGAGAVVLPGVTIGRFAMVAAGAVVTRNVPDHGLVLGIPARLDGHVCRCGERLTPRGVLMHCPTCDSLFQFVDEGTTLVPLAAPASAAAVGHTPT
ncbi:MAG TPA: acyltransferase [Thermoleophilia bacterium]|nr:acyltransferase [Thermoleophilia bacterium]